MRGIWNDIAHSLRTLQKAPLFTAAVIVVLALGIGAASTVFSVVNAVVLRPVPFPDAERVLNLAWHDGQFLSPGLTAARFAFWKERAQAFRAFASWRPFRAHLGQVAPVSSARVLRVTHGFFDVVGLEPAVGRAFTLEEHVAGTKVALVSREFWKKLFGGEPDLSGRVLRLEEEAYTIVGLLPDAFLFPYEADPIDVIVPIGLSVDPNDEAANWPAIARLAHGFTTAQAHAEVAALNSAFRATYPQQVGERDRGVTLASFDQLYVGPTRHAIWILMVAASLVLLIACANAASLFLARMLPRRTEMAVRAALGATRIRIMRLVLAEGLVVSVAAGAVGILIANWGANLLVALSPVQVPRADSVGVDWTVVMFACAMSLATAIVAGAAACPAAWAGLSQILQENSRTNVGRTRLQQAFLAGQAALSILLLVGAGLLVRTWFNLEQVDPGFDADHLVVAKVPTRPPSYGTSRSLWEFEGRVVENLTRSSAAISVAGASTLPLERGVNVPLSVTGRDEFGASVEWRAVTPSYFQTLGIELVEGRVFEHTDGPESMKVAVVNQAFARRFFNKNSPVGRGIDIGRRGDAYIDPSLKGSSAIVGVTEDIRDVSLRTQPRPTVYVPLAQAPDMLLNVRPTMPVFLARSHVNGARIEQKLREAIRTTDPFLPDADVFPLSEAIADSLARERFGAILLTVFAAVALILTTCGIYSVVTYSVRQRRREIGVRMALGAGRVEVALGVLAQGLRPIAIGISLGLIGAVAMSQLLEAYLWGVAPEDPKTLAVVSIAILGIAAVACWIPAREAVSVNPAQTLNT